MKATSVPSGEIVAWASPRCVLAEGIDVSTWRTPWESRLSSHHPSAPSSRENVQTTVITGASTREATAEPDPATVAASAMKMTALQSLIACPAVTNRPPDRYPAATTATTNIRSRSRLRRGSLLNQDIPDSFPE